jgi:hypothetical protein
MKPYLAGNASGDYDNLDPIKSLLEFVCRVTIDLVLRHSVGAGRTRRGTLTSPGVADVGGDSGGATDVIQAQGSNERTSFEQERERLADSSTRTKDGDLGVTGGGF